MKIRRGDKVKVISGKDKGKTGKVLKVFPRLGKVVVEGINILKKHQKPRRQGEKGGRISFPGPISISNVQLICTKCEKPTRVGFEKSGEKKVRICKKCGAQQ